MQILIRNPQGKLYLGRPKCNGVSRRNRLRRYELAQGSDEPSGSVLSN